MCIGTCATCAVQFPSYRNGPVESHYFVLALDMRLYEAVIAMTAWIRKENPFN